MATAANVDAANSMLDLAFAATDGPGALGSELANIAVDKYGGRVVDGVKKAVKSGKGIVYRRTNPETGSCYIGQCKNGARYKSRQKEHNRQDETDYEFEVLEENLDAADLDYVEDTYIREEGLENLDNKRHQISQKRRDEYERKND